mgnify:CR=1 FL=1
MKFQPYILSVLLSVTVNFAVCQNITSLSFRYCDSVPVFNSDNDRYLMPWIGGINSAQICKIDLNLDKIDDMIVFDRIGNRIMPFVFSENAPGQFVYSPQYIDLLPPISNWIVTADYNNDSKSDIFTYTTGGIKVYKNVSDEHNLMFEQVTFPYLRSHYNNVYANILATAVDYPGICDIDSDGDLDIFVFGALGAYVEFHHNYGMEKYNSADSLIFYKESDCWGSFAESEESNEIILNTCLGDKGVGFNQDEKHTGSTFLFLDADNNGTYDLVLGDVDYSTPCVLFNKDNSDAHIIDYSFVFPDSYPISINSFPVLFKSDLDHDGYEELVVSTFDPDVNKCDGLNSVWLYKIVDNDGYTDYQLITKSFIQEDMIDVGNGAFPVLMDYDNDNLLDLFIGNDGYCDSCYHQYGTLKCDYTSMLAYYRNCGTADNPRFCLVTADFAGLSSLHVKGIYPAFLDYDGDGDCDLFVGTADGVIIRFENNGGDYVMMDSDWLGLSAYSEKYLTPSFYDFNGDGTMDMVVGNSRGTLWYFEGRAGDSTAVFELKTTVFGAVDVRDADMSWTGYSVPSAFSYHDTTFLSVGSESGNIYLYIINDVDAPFEVVNDVEIGNQGFRVAPAVGYLKKYPDMLVGNFSGGIQYFKGISRNDVGIAPFDYGDLQAEIYPNPLSSDNVNVRMPQNVSGAVIRLFSITGGLLLESSLRSGLNEINLSDFYNGIYFYDIKSGCSSVKGKLLIVR